MRNTSFLLISVSLYRDRSFRSTPKIGHDLAKQSVTINRNHRSRLSEMTGHDAPKYAGKVPEFLRKDTFIVPLTVSESAVGFIYIEPTRDMPELDRHLIQIAANQCSSALENLKLHRNLAESYAGAIEMLAQIAEFKDKTTGDHIRRLEQYTRLMAIELGMSKDEATFYANASQLHDIGKVGIPESILHKPGKLTEEEFEIIKTHTVIGASILSQQKHLDLARNIALSHHERWDGKGYPNGVYAKELHFAVRIVSVIDVFDALVCCRPYKLPWPVQKAANLIKAGAGSQFDPVVVMAFLKLLEQGKFDEIINTTQGQQITEIVSG